MQQQNGAVTVYLLGDETVDELGESEFKTVEMYINHIFLVTMMVV